MGYWHPPNFRQVQTRNRCVRFCTKESHCFSCGSVKKGKGIFKRKKWQSVGQFINKDWYLQNLVSEKAHGFNRVYGNENFKM